MVGPSIGISSCVVPLVSLGKSKHRSIGDIATLYQAYSFQLGQDSKARDGLVGEVQTATKVDVANSIAVVDKAFDRFVRQVGTMTQVNIVQVLAEFGDGKDGLICDVAALGKNHIAQTGSSLNYLLHGPVGHSLTRCQIEDAEVFVCLARRKGQECAVVDELAVCQSEFSQRLAFNQERCDRSVADQLALLQVYLKNVWAIVGKSKDSLVRNLAAFVQFELEIEVSTEEVAIKDKTGSHTRFRYLQFSARVTRDSGQIFTQLEMLRPWSRLQCSAMTLIDSSVI